MATLLDQHGNPIKKTVMTQEHATPSMAGVRSLLSDQATNGLTPLRLGRMIRAADEGSPESYLAMAEELEEKDPHYASVLGTRKRAVSQLEITVEAASDSKDDEANADLVRAWLKNDELEGYLFDMLDAVGKGYSATEMIWECSELQWIPKDLVWRPPNWFVFAEDGYTLRLRQGASSIELPQYKYIIHRHKSKSGLTVRGGIVRPCAWMWLFKNFSIKDWVIFAEAYGQPIRIGKYNAGATAADREILLRAVSQIGSDAAAIIPESMQIEFVEAQNKGGSADVFKTLIDFADQQISKAVLGQTTTTDAIAGGHAVSKEHNEVRRDIERADAKLLQSTLNRELVIPIVAFNRGPQKDYPRLRIGRTEDIDIEKVSAAADKAVRMGMPVSIRGLRDKLGLPEPEDQDDVLRLPGVATAPAPGQTASSQLIKPVTAAAQSSDTPPDAVDQLTDDLTENWEEFLTPISSVIEDAMQNSESFDDFQTRLLETLQKMNLAAVTDRIAQADFVTRLAGNLDVDLKRDGD